MLDAKQTKETGTERTLQAELKRHSSTTLSVCWIKFWLLMKFLSSRWHSNIYEPFDVVATMVAAGCAAFATASWYSWCYSRLLFLFFLLLLYVVFWLVASTKWRKLNQQSLSHSRPLHICISPCHHSLHRKISNIRLEWSGVSGKIQSLNLNFSNHAIYIIHYIHIHNIRTCHLLHNSQFQESD